MDRRPELIWTICAFEFKRSVCCGKATGGKARGRQFGANLVLPYVVRKVHIFARAVEVFCEVEASIFTATSSSSFASHHYIVIKCHLSTGPPSSTTVMITI